MYAMDSAVHTEHSSEARRARRESWRDRWHAPAQARPATEPCTSTVRDAGELPGSAGCAGFAD